MKKIIVFLSVVILMVGLSSAAFCAGPSKMGIIDFQKIVKESSAGKITQKQLKKKGEEFQKIVLEEKRLLDELKKKFESEALILVLTPEQKQQKQEEFAKKVKNFNNINQDLNKRFEKLRIDLFKRMQNQVFIIANKIGKEEQYQLIIEKNDAGVIFYQDQIDITDQIIKQYNLNISKAN
jgi:outer membrane protein